MPCMRNVMSPRCWEHRAILIRNFLENGSQNGDFYVNTTNPFMLQIPKMMFHYKQNSFLFVLCKGWRSVNNLLFLCFFYPLPIQNATWTICVPGVGKPPFFKCSSAGGKEWMSCKYSLERISLWRMKH